MIIVFGSINMDLFFNPARAPAAGETVLLDNYTTLPGGKGANQAVAARRMGSEVLMAGCLGADPFGGALRDVLTENGIDTDLIATGDKKTGTAVIILEENGENRILVAGGANGEADSTAIPDALLTPAATVLMQMETDPAQVAALAARAQGRAGRVILNMAPAIFPGHDALRALDYLILNEIEVTQLAETLGHSASPPANAVTHGTDTGIGNSNDNNHSHTGRTDADNTADHARQAAAAIARDYGLTCVITLGADGAFAATPDGGLHTAPALKNTRVVDTTGAGDGFCGAFAAALDQGRTLDDALRLACATGSLACQTMGAIASYPQRETVDQALRESAGPPAAGPARPGPRPGTARP